MFCYQIKVGIRPFKMDEFVESVRSLTPGIRNTEDCLGFNLYRNDELKDACVLVGEWRTRRAMEAHFMSRNFEVLVGAIRVLGKNYEMILLEVLKSGGIELAKDMISSDQ